MSFKIRFDLVVLIFAIMKYFKTHQHA